MPSTIVIESDGVHEEIDCAPMEQYMEMLGQPGAVTEQLQLARQMTQRQLQFLACELTGEVEKYRRLYDASFSKEHLKFVGEIHDLKRMVAKAGMALWPDIRI